MQEFKNTLGKSLPEHWPQQPEQQKPEPQPGPKPEPEKKDPELEKLEAALKQRNAKQSREMKERHETEIERLKQTHKTDTEELLEARRRVQKLELDRFYRKAEEHSDDWVKKFSDIVKQRWNPAAAEQQRIERQQKIDEIKTRQRIERETLIETRKIQRDAAIEEMKHRHGQEISAQEIRNKAELERYKREQEAARKNLEQMEREQLEIDRTKKPDEPDPPKRSL